MRPSVHRPQHTRRHATRTLYAPDRIGIVAFNDTGFVIAKPAEAHAAWLQERTRQLHRKVTGCYTNIADGLRKAVAMLQATPRGVIRRCWLLTDGYANKEAHAIMPVVDQARASYININTIGFGDPHNYDAALLQRIAAATHNGKYLSVRSLRELTDSLIASDNGHRGSHRHRRRSECTVLCLDLSGSMTGPMGDRRKIEVVEEAILHLLHYKQQLFS